MVDGNLLIFIEKQHKMSGKTNRQLLNIDRNDMRRACRFFWTTCRTPKPTF